MTKQLQYWHQLDFYEDRDQEIPSSNAFPLSVENNVIKNRLHTQFLPTGPLSYQDST